MDNLIQRIKAKISHPSEVTENSDVMPSQVFPVADEATLQAAEQTLGFRFPTLLRRLYLEIGNGGFGPGYGLIGVPSGATDGGNSVVDLYQGYSKPDPNDIHWKWKEALLPICHLGCAMYACIDCTTDEGAVVWFEPNPHCEGESWDDSFIPIASSIEDWLSAWLDNKNLLEEGWKQKFGEEVS
jgi:hypothetical protein